MKMPEQLQTERLVLRKPRVGDAYAILEGWAQDQEVRRYLTWRPYRRREETQEFIQHCLSMWEHETRFPYMITWKENGEVIGMIDPRLEIPKVGIGYGECRFAACLGKGWNAITK